MKRIITLLCFLFIPFIVSAQSYEIVLKTDFEGAVSEGSITQLISEIQAGTSVRIGWQFDWNKDGVSDLEHWIDASFLTISNGHVYNQIEMIQQQMPMPDDVLITPENNTWYGLISTKGILQHKFIFDKLPVVADTDGNPLTEEQIKLVREDLNKLQNDVVATMWAVSK